MRSIKGQERLEIISAFRKKLESKGLTIADFSRKEGISKAYFYKLMYDDESGLYGKVRDSILNLLVE